MKESFWVTKGPSRSKITERERKKVLFPFFVKQGKLYENDALLNEPLDVRFLAFFENVGFELIKGPKIPGTQSNI